MPSTVRPDAVCSAEDLVTAAVAGAGRELVRERVRIIMDKKKVGLAGLRGWRSSVANAVAPPVAERSPLGEDQVRAVVGAIFLVLSLLYVLGAVRDLLAARD